jgi:4-hydroxybenzoate polyprenyltransferase
MRLIASDIKLAHSVFALPFAVLASFLAGPFPAQDSLVWRHFAGQLALVVVCMVVARSWAMIVNRLADRSLDAKNVRTQRRVFASGRLSTRAGTLALISCGVAFVACASLFWVFYRNPWPAYLALPVLAWIAFYSFTKRFTALCHVFLGGALAASPIAAAIAIDPASLSKVPALWCIAGFVLLWVAGFDIIYALQDEIFDRGAGLFSIPASLGPRGAAWVSRCMHLGALLCLIAAWRWEPRLGLVFASGCVLVLGLLVWEHTIVAHLVRASLKPGSPPPALDMAFFTLNGVVSVLLGVAGVVDVVV